MYNAITRGLEPELIPTCRRYGIDVVIYNPLAGGLFSGKYTLDQIPDEGRFSAAVGDMGEQYRERYFRDSFFGSLKLIEPAVKKAGLAMTETALRWCVHHSALRVGGVKYLDDEKNSTPLNDGIIIGVSSQAQLEANLRDLEKGPLPEEVVNALDQAWKIAMLDQPEYWRYKLEYGYDTKKALFPV
jgi:aflatoxin B1 aldehyde reductase